MIAPDQLHTTVDEWIERTEHDLTFSPGPVQDLLFDLWGASEHVPDVRVEIERWLTLSLTRNLFSADEVRDLLVRWRDSMGASASSGA